LHPVLGQKHKKRSKIQILAHIPEVFQHSPNVLQILSGERLKSCVVNLQKGSRSVSHVSMNGIEESKKGVCCKLHVGTPQREVNPNQARLRHGLPLALAWMTASRLIRLKLHITPDFLRPDQNTIQLSDSCGVSKEQLQFSDSNFPQSLTQLQYKAVEQDIMSASNLTSCPGMTHAQFQ